jgi:nicotinate-nucleotide adenylyltransferase
LGRKIGVFGGTFNPLHNGHINIVKSFKQNLGLDFVLLIPTYSPPHKSKMQIISGEYRLEMCKLVCEDYNWLFVSDIEILRKGKSYTIDTLKELLEIYPRDSLFLLMGADMFLTLRQWKDFDEITQLSALCATARHEGELTQIKQYAQGLKSDFKAECYIENIPVLDISSTQIRDGIKNSENVSSLLPNKVLDYIKIQNLYI